MTVVRACAARRRTRGECVDPSGVSKSNVDAHHNQPRNVYQGLETTRLDAGCILPYDKLISQSQHRFRRQGSDPSGLQD